MLPSPPTDIFDTPSLLPGYENRPLDNADSGNWEWPEEARSRSGWELAPKLWQDFNARWRTGGEVTDRVSLADVDSPHLSLTPLHPDDPPNDHPATIYVRRFYEELFKRVWESALMTEIGHIIIGQPGTGKKTLLPYLLIRLLQQKQIVLFTVDGVNLYLFYHGQVYFGQTKSTLALPERTKDDIFIWSLFNIKNREEAAEVLLRPQCLPVLTASPDGSQYRIWRAMGTMAPQVVIMPMWSRDELARGLRYQKRYQALLNALAEAYPEMISCVPPSTQKLQSRFPGIGSLFAKYDSDPATAENGLNLPVASPSENVLVWLLNMAIKHFGFVARDVFEAVFDFRTVELRHEEAFLVGFSDVEETVAALVAGNQSYANNAPQYIISMHPPDNDIIGTTSYQLKWKSDWVTTRIAERLHLIKDTEIQQNISYFQSLPQTRPLAGVYFEELARRSLVASVSGE